MFNHHNHHIDPNMPIKYAKKYVPKYYNPNWGINSSKKMAWEQKYGSKYGININPQTKQITPSPQKNANTK